MVYFKAYLQFCAASFGDINGDSEEIGQDLSYKTVDRLLPVLSFQMPECSRWSIQITVQKSKRYGTAQPLKLQARNKYKNMNIHSKTSLLCM